MSDIASSDERPGTLRILAYRLCLAGLVLGLAILSLDWIRVPLTDKVQPNLATVATVLLTVMAGGAAMLLPRPRPRPVPMVLLAIGAVIGFEVVAVVLTDCVADPAKLSRWSLMVALGLFFCLHPPQRPILFAGAVAGLVVNLVTIGAALVHADISLEPLRQAVPGFAMLKQFRYAVIEPALNAFVADPRYAVPFSVKNAVAGSILVQVLLAFIHYPFATPAVADAARRPWLRIATAALIVCNLVIVLLMLSRSALVILAWLMLCVGFIHVRQWRPGARLAFHAGALGFAVFAAMIASYDLDPYFSRMRHIQELLFAPDALKLLSCGVTLDASGNRIHNLVLSALVETGVPSAAMALAFVLGLVWLLVRVVRQAWAMRARPLTPQRLGLLLLRLCLILPVLRAMEGGDGGFPLVGDWLMLGLALASLQPMPPADDADQHEHAFTKS